MQVEIEQREQHKPNLQIDSPTMCAKDVQLQSSEPNLQDLSTCESSKQIQAVIKHFEINIPYQHNADGLRVSTLIQCPYYLILSWQQTLHLYDFTMLNTTNNSLGSYFYAELLFCCIILSRM